MQTHFSPERLRKPALKIANDILRTCVHCGFCLATCPTYVLLGDELDSPRGRIYLMREMLEKDAAPRVRVVKHIDRCLSCLSCMSTCPSGVDYRRLVDHVRNHIEATYTRPLPERLLRGLLAFVLPNPRVFRLALRAGRWAQPFRAVLPGRLKGMVAMAPARLPARAPVGELRAQKKAKLRVALLPGCAQQVLQPRINQAAARVLARLGADVVEPADVGCCGALEHHMGREKAALARARAVIAAFERAAPDVIAISASGCGATLKDYAYLLKDDPHWCVRAQALAAKVRDVCEVVAELGLEGVCDFAKPRVAYHAPCSLQHAQNVADVSLKLLKQAGFRVSTPKDAHLCCGSAGIYNLMQPQLAAALGRRKADALEARDPHVIATGNIGCRIQIGEYADVPVVHTIELLDWATGGDNPLK